MTVELSELLDFNNTDGIHYRLAQTDPKRFQMIEDYLYNGDWESSIVKDDSTNSVPRLSKVALGDQTRQNWIEDCSFVWITAEKLRLIPLQRHVLDKLKLLAPFTDLGILIVASAAREARYAKALRGESQTISIWK